MKKYGGKGRTLPIHEIKKFGRQIIEVRLLYQFIRGFYQSLYAVMNNVT